MNFITIANYNNLGFIDLKVSVPLVLLNVVDQPL